MELTLQQQQDIGLDFVLDRLLPLVDRLEQTIPVYELENDATRDSVRLSCETMRRGAEEAGL